MVHGGGFGVVVTCAHMNACVYVCDGRSLDGGGVGLSV